MSVKLQLAIGNNMRAIVNGVIDAPLLLAGTITAVLWSNVPRSQGTKGRSLCGSG